MGWDRRAVLASLGAVTTATAGCASPAQPSERSPTTHTTDRPQVDARDPVIHVSPGGGPQGSGTADDPYAGVQAGLDVASPGQTVRLHDGTYRLDSPGEAITTVRSGSADAPITIAGSPDATVTGPSERPADGGGSAPLFEINHDHIRLLGLTLDGLADPASPDTPSSYRGNLVEVSPAGTGYLRGIVVRPARVGNTLASAISLARVRGADVGGFELIGPVGVQYRRFGTDSPVGEVVYVGQSVPTGSGPDRTRNVRVHHIDNTAGYGHSELVNVKPATSDVVVEYCSDLGGAGQDPDTQLASVNLQCGGATVRWCDLSNHADAGIRVGVSIRAEEFPDGEIPPGLDDAGTGNAIYGNRLVGNAGPAIAYAFPDEQGPADQRVVCGNDIEGSTLGSPTTDCPSAIPRSDQIGHTGGQE